MLDHLGVIKKPKINWRNFFGSPQHWKQPRINQAQHAEQSRKHIRFKVMGKDELCEVLFWAKREGWNPGRHELLPLYQADPTGYHLLEFDGKTIASLAAVKHGSDYACVGLYIVTPEYRHKGYGKQLWDSVINSLDCKTTYLNSVTEQVKNYERSGFVSTSVNLRWQGVPITCDQQRSARTDDVIITSVFDIVSVIEYDSKVFPVQRSDFLSAWIAMPESLTLVAFEGNRVVGYGTISRCVQGYKIAPLFADDASIAEKLYIDLCSGISSSETIYFDTNENNQQANLMMKNFRMKKVFETVRMCKGKELALNDKSAFGLTSLEIG